MKPLKFGEAVQVGNMSMTVTAPVTIDGSHYYGARSWKVQLHAENSGSVDVQLPLVKIRCDDGKEGGSWVGASLSEGQNVPAKSFLDGDLILSTPVDNFGDPATLHDCQIPRLRVGDHLSDSLG